MHRIVQFGRSLPLARKILLINGAVAFVAWTLSVAVILFDQYRGLSNDITASAERDAPLSTTAEEGVGSARGAISAPSIVDRVLSDAYPLIAIAGLGSLCVVVLTGLIVPVSLRRLGSLTQTMRSVRQQNNFALRADVKGGDEVGELAVAFNAMLDHIQSRDASLRRELVERQRAETQNAYLANHDSTTGLPNRRHFNELLASVRGDGTPARGHLGVLVLNLDQFKMVNDSLGNNAADQLLVEVGARMRDCVGEKDVVCRLGGDEFAVVFDCLQGESQAEALGKHLIDAIARPMRAQGTEVSLRASAGIALSNQELTAEQILRNADTAMREAKEAGKGLVRLFRPYMSDRVQHRLTLEQDLRKALERDQLHLYYQPQFDAASGKIVGAEALMRWQHPRLGNVSPVQFIPIAEESGLIVLLGAWAMQRATLDAKAWQAQGLEGVAVSVNVSARQFLEPGFVSTVLNTLEHTGLDPRLLELELTESLLVDPYGASMKNLAALNERGIALAIDDFGTGYSSMAYLKRFPMQRLKIDRSFIQNIPQETDDMAIAGAMIALGHKLGMEIVAEGVENRAQYNFLVDQSCDRIQGFLFSRPLALDDLLSSFGATGEVPHTEAYRLSA